MNNSSRRSNADLIFMKIPHGPDRWICPYCFKEERELNGFITCTGVYKTYNDLNKHLKKFHTRAVIQWRCGECGFTDQKSKYPQRAVKAHHAKVHEGSWRKTLLPLMLPLMHLFPLQRLIVQGWSRGDLSLRCDRVPPQLLSEFSLTLALLRTLCSLISRNAN